MRKRNIFALSVLSCMLTVPAIAGWQYDGIYVGDGYYADTGSRFVVSARGGVAFGTANIKNNIGAVYVGYYQDPGTNTVLDEWRYKSRCKSSGDCDVWDFIGVADISELPANKDFSSVSFAGGISIGWRTPGKTQWRFEAGWDHISKTDYNASPMFSGELVLQDGVVPSSLYLQSGSVNSEVTTDVISAMAFYDFFKGTFFPKNKFVPYIGFGFGYADTLTQLNMTDPEGTTLQGEEFESYGESINGIITSFYPSEYHTSNIAGLLSAGVSYAFSNNLFFDFGVRMMYLPRIKWELTNVDDTRHREMFSAENMIYTNVMAGIRFEF